MASRPRSRRRERSDTVARILAAIPAIAFAIFIVSQGGIVFALGLIALGVLAMAELYTMMERVRPPNLAGFVTLVALVLAALYGTKQQVLLVLVLSVPLTFFLALVRPRREHISWAMAVVFLGILWIGVAVAHGVFLREMHHGGGLVLDVLIGTFIGDTAAYFGGRAWGRRPLAPRISPNKTLEGLLTGVVGGTLAFWLFAVAYQHEWFKGPDALLIGFVVALVGPVGDLFESAIKRDLDVKDTGRFFGAHGGVLDRVDAVLFTLVAGYYMAQAVLG
ncbi:MAG TPA: phosphatidate cytidylyltransferase [Thermoleophilaceae bacterium]